MSERQICEAFILLADLAKKDGITALNQHAGCWMRKVGDHWWFAVNGHTEAKPASSPDGASKDGPFQVDPFHCYIEFNGWPAGVFTPYGGTIAAGAAGNEDSFIAALKVEIAA